MEFCLNEVKSSEEIYQQIEKFSNENLSELINYDNELMFINFIKVAFVIFSQKNKKMYEQTDKVIKDIVLNVNPWFTPYISDILCEFIDI